MRASDLGLIEIDDRQQILRCLKCNATEEVLRRTWQREDLRLDAIEQFVDEHEECARFRLKELKIQFFSRPFRRKTMKASQISRGVVMPQHMLLKSKNQQVKRLGR